MGQFCAPSTFSILDGIEISKVCYRNEVIVILTSKRDFQ